MHRYFTTNPIFSAPVASVDRENGIIRGVTIAQAGPARGHGGYIDRTFLLQIVDNAASRSAGIKARFGHPNMCSTALGTYLGRFQNYSFSNNKVNADLYLDNTARITPNGDLFTYVLDMAEQNPDMFGASIVFEIAESVFLTEEMDGKKVEKEYFRLKELRATDIVDDPAATDGLFSVRLSSRTLSGAEGFPAIATQFLDENPEIMELVFSKPGTVAEFLSNYITNSKMNLSDKIKENFAAFLDSFSVPQVKPLDDPEPETQNSTQQFADSESTIRNLQSEITTLQSEIENLQSEIRNQQSEIEHQQTEIRNQQSEIEKLSARPSIPLNVTDPIIGVGTGKPEKDETGKQILASMPKDLKHKLK